MQLIATPQHDDETYSDGDGNTHMPRLYQPQPTIRSIRSETAGRPLTSPPLPGILKARVKHER
ncbi:hypothetical protein GIB67_038847 [Kingdonia uniflora]|nr:hypothetical protein GIB67_038847 [Kingdonia uniflora]